MIVNKVRQYQRANLNQTDVELYILKHSADSYTIHSSHTHTDTILLKRLILWSLWQQREKLLFR